MWEVDNHSPFPHHAGFLRDHEGRTLWRITLKATFAIRPDQTLRYTKPQPPISQSPLTKDNLIIADSDLSPPRPMCDVILMGSACPPDGTTSSGGWLASLRIGNWRKAMQILPSQKWHRGQARPSAATGPVPLDWSAAWGGPGVADNPLGQGYSREEGAPLHRLAPEGKDARSQIPIAFSAVPPSWPARSRLAGTYDEAWQRRRAPLLPQDLEPSFWQSAPSDQWLDPAAIADSEVEIIGICSVPVRFRLPRLDFEIMTRFQGRWIEHSAVPQSLSIDSDRMTLSLVLQSVLPINAAQFDVKLDRTAITMRDSHGFVVAAADMPALDAAPEKESSWPTLS